MYPTSDTYKEKVKELDRVWESRVDIEHEKGTLRLDDKDIALSGLSVTEKTQPGEDFTAGGTVASDLNLKILNKPEYKDINFTGAKIKPYVMLTEDEGRNFLLNSEKEITNEKQIEVDVHNALQSLEGEEITISFDVKGNKSKGVFKVFTTGKYDIGEHFFDITTDYKRVSFTTIVRDRNNGDTNTKMHIKEVVPQDFAVYGVLKYGQSLYAERLTLSIRKRKIEIGDRDTGWRPAVEEWSRPIPLGVFNVDTQSRFKSTIELKAMDNMIKLDRSYNYSKLTYPATLYQIYVDACSTCNLLPDTHNFLHKDLLIQNRPEGDFSCRDILGFVAQLSGSFAKITRDGKVALKWYEPTGLELGIMNRDDFKPSDEEINITGIMFKESDEKTYLVGTDDYAIDLTENPLLQQDYSKVLPAILNKIKEIKFNPYTVSKWQGNPAVEAGDMVRHIDVDGNIFDTIITGSTYRYRMKGSMEAKAKSEVNKGYKGSTSKKLANVVQKIENNRVEVEDKLTSVEQAQLNAMELLSNMLGGHLIIDEENATIYIANSPDLAKATEWWQWGIAGFAHFKNGVPDTSITADGSIVAMLVAAHIITADMVRTGLLQSEDGNTWINLDNGYFNLKNVIYDDKGFRILVGDETLEETINSINTQNPNFLLFSDEEQEDIQLVFLVSERVSPLDSMYTFSMKSKYNYDNVNIRVIIMDGDGNQYDFDTILNGNTLEFSFDGNELIKKGFKTIGSIMLFGFRYGLNSLQAKLERGVKATEWVPAWEDVENKLDELNNKVVEVKQTTEGFRISIDDYSSGKLKGTNYIFDSKNATFKGAGLKILNNYDEEVLVGDTRGNLTMRGSLVTYQNDNKAVEIQGNSVNLYDWVGTDREEYVGKIYASRRDDDATKPAMLLSHNEGAFSAITHYDSKAGIHYSYIDFDKYDVLNKDDTGYPIVIYTPVSFEGNKIKLENIEMQAWQDNNVLKFKDKRRSSSTALIFADSARISTDGIYASNDIYSAGSLGAAGNLTIQGSKNSLQKTKNYGERLINAYETAEYFFGDIGSGKINEHGECIVYIDDILQECINVEVEYHIFTQFYSGKIKTIEREKNYFIVYGEPNTEFSWELKAKRRGYEHHRLEVQQVEEPIMPSNFDDELEYTEDTDESQKLLEKALEFDVIDLLFEEGI